MDNIEKLKEKVANDPKSTLFVPLAEEYRKAGQLDEAIDVLKAGIEQQPGYMSARVSLGKIYLEKDMKQEAREEFQKVVKAIPDNLFAIKKLAEIARAMSDREGAIRHYKRLLSLNSMDEDSQQILQLLLSGGGIEEPPKDEPVEAEAAEISGEEAFEPLGAPLEELEQQMPRTAGEQAPLEDGDLVFSLADKDVFEERPADEVEPDVLMAGGDDLHHAAEVSPGVDEAVEVESFGIPESDGGAEIAELDGEPDFGEIVLTGDEDMELETSAADFAEDLSPGSVEQDDIDMMFGESGYAKVSEEPVAAAGGQAEAAHAAPAVDESFDVHQAVGGAAGNSQLADADAMVASGDYAGAMDIYLKLLEQDSQNVEVLQKSEELKSLLKLLGKENEVSVARLEGFLDSVKRRRDEFFGRS